MFKMLVADDEKVERSGIVKLVQKFGLPLETVEAVNGREALDFLENNPTDILLTDIKMPFMNGLELVEKAKQAFPRLKVIIFSAYGEFEYAKEAVKLDVVHYLLKPIMIDEFLEVMNKVLAQCETDLQQLKRDEEVREDFLRWRADERERNLLNVLNGNAVQPEDMNLLMQAAPIDYENAGLVLFDYRQSFYDKNGGSFNKELHRIIDIPFEYLNINQYQSLIILGRKEGRDKKRLTAIGQDLLHAMKVKFAEPPGVVLGVLQEMAHLRTEYERMEHLLEYRFFFPDSFLMSTWDENSRLQGEETWVAKVAADIRDCLEIWDLNGAEQQMLLLFESLKGHALSNIYFKYTCAEMAKKMLSMLEGQPAARMEQLLLQIFKSTAMEQLESILSELFMELNRKYGGESQKSNRKTVNEIIHYIAHHYTEDISLESIGSSVYLSPGYLSSFFKKETGQSLTRFITAYRLDKAKELLAASNLKVVDVARNVGFSDTSYFCHVFKNYVGMSPAKFKEMHGR